MTSPRLSSGWWIRTPHVNVRSKNRSRNGKSTSRGAHEIRARSVLARALQRHRTEIDAPDVGWLQSTRYRTQIRALSATHFQHRLNGIFLEEPIPEQARAVR